jgi:hypothetical protein
MRAHRDRTRTPQAKREARRQREFELYELHQRERETMRAIGGQPEAERFSEIELESRIRDVLGDYRATSWEDLAQLGERYGVMVDRRGSDVRYAMLREREDGSFTAGRSDTRRGKGLGEGFQIEDVETAFVQNAERAAELERERAERSAHARSIARGDEQQPVDRVAQLRQQYPDEMAEEEARIRAELGDSAYTNLIAEGTLKARAEDPAFSTTLEDARQRRQQEAAEREATERAREGEAEAKTPSTTAVEEEPTPPFRSRLRGVQAKGKDSTKTQERIDGLAPIEEEYHDRAADADLEARLKQLGIAGAFIREYGEHLSPEFYDVLVDRSNARKRSNDAVTAGMEKHKRLPDLTGAERDAMRQQRDLDDAHGQDIRRLVDEGKYREALAAPRPTIVREDVVAEAAVRASVRPSSIDELRSDRASGSYSSQDEGLER